MLVICLVNGANTGHNSGVNSEVNSVYNSEIPEVNSGRS